MKRIFSRVAHAFKHDDVGVHDDSHGGESGSMTSVDSGVLEDVSPEPPADQRRGSVRQTAEVPASSEPVSDPGAATELQEADTDKPSQSAVSDQLTDALPTNNSSTSVGQQPGMDAEPAGAAEAAEGTAGAHAGRRAVTAGDLQCGEPPRRPPSPHSGDRLIRTDSAPDTAAAGRPAGPSVDPTAVCGDQALQQTPEKDSAVNVVSESVAGEGGGVSGPMSDGDAAGGAGVNGAPPAAAGDDSAGACDAAETSAGAVKSVEKSATDASLADSDGVLLETATEDTGDDLDGKPKEKKKKRRKKKNKAGAVESASLDVVPAVGNAPSESETTVAGAAEPEKAANADAAAPTGSGSQPADQEGASTKSSEPAAAAKGKAASSKKPNKTRAGQTTAAKKPTETASQRRTAGQPASRANVAKQASLENTSRSSTPSRTPENPARTRLKRDLHKAVSIESNSSTGSRTSTSSRPSSAARKASNTTPRGGVVRKNSLTASNASISTTAANREEVRSPPGSRDQQGKTPADRKTPKTSTSGKKTSESAGAAAASSKTAPSKKLSAPAQTQPAKTEKKTKTSLVKEKKAPTGRRKSEKVGASAPADKSSTVSGKSPQSKQENGNDSSTKPAEAVDAEKPAASEVEAVPKTPDQQPSGKDDCVQEPSSRPPLDKSDTIQETIRRPPLLQYDTIDKDPARPPLTPHNTIDDDPSRPPLTQHDTVDNDPSRPPLTQHDTIDVDSGRSPLAQDDTNEKTSSRPPLLEQETVEETAVLPTLAQQQESMASAFKPLTSEQATPEGAKSDVVEAVNRPLVNGLDVADSSGVKSGAGRSGDVSGKASPGVPTISIESTFHASDVAASPTVSSPCEPSSTPGGDMDKEAASVPPPPPDSGDASSRRSSVEVLDEGRPKLRRSCSSQGDPVSPHDPVLEVMTQVHADSEARLAARRQARAEAREIRMRELERQQREAELNGEKPDDFADVPVRASPASSVRTPRGVSGSLGRRGSEDSAEDASPGPALHLRDVRHELRELEEKLRKTMVTSAQLDNDKATLGYQVELLKDRLEELQEAHTQLQREHRTRCSDHEQLKRVSNRLKEDLTLCKKLLDERDKLIAENGLVLVGDEEDEEAEQPAPGGQKALVSQAAAELLEKAGGGTLDSRLRRLGEEKNELEDQLRRLKLELEEERHMNARARISGSGGAADSDAVQREVARQLGEYRFKLQKADQDITNLQTAVQRLENQVARYKTAAETAEKAEEELKGEKRKLQRELRESLTRVDELETTNSHLQKRLDKLKNARSNLLKDLSTE